MRKLSLALALSLVACSASQPADHGTAGSSGAAGASGVTGGAGGAGGAGAGGAAGTNGSCSACAAVGDEARLIAVPYPALQELSGLAASRVHDGVLYAHNDSGDTARFFAITADGAAAGEFVLKGELATDWEDVAAGPCDAGRCLFFADTGDNDAKRAEVALVKVTEPSLPPQPGAPIELSAERVRFVYPDGPHDVEALLVHPESGDAYLVTKVEPGPSAVYKLAAPLAAGAVRTATKVATLSVPAGGSLLITGGDAHPCGDRLILRTYSGLFEYRAPTGAPFEAAFDAVPVSLTAPSFGEEPQGEAVAYLASGLGFVTGSEDPLHKAARPLRARACE